MFKCDDVPLDFSGMFVNVTSHSILSINLNCHFRKQNDVHVLGHKCEGVLLT